MGADGQQVIVLRDSAGEYYAIPVTVVQNYRISDQLRDTIAAAASAPPEVQAMGPPYPVAGPFEIQIWYWLSMLRWRW